jgi:hypothetical protein
MYAEELCGASRAFSGVAVCCSVKARAMTSLQETCEGVLQYLEAAAEGEVPTEEPLILSSIRCFGR